jgi:hypothetical protein
LLLAVYTPVVKVAVGATAAKATLLRGASSSRVSELLALEALVWLFAQLDLVAAES